jgi:hypothetical protein
MNPRQSSYAPSSPPPSLTKGPPRSSCRSLLQSLITCTAPSSCCVAGLPGPSPESLVVHEAPLHTMLYPRPSVAATSHLACINWRESLHNVWRIGVDTAQVGERQKCRMMLVEMVERQGRASVGSDEVTQVQQHPASWSRSGERGEGGGWRQRARGKRHSEPPRAARSCLSLLTCKSLSASANAPQLLLHDGVYLRSNEQRQHQPRLPGPSLSCPRVAPFSPFAPPANQQGLEAILAPYYARGASVQEIQDVTERAHAFFLQSCVVGLFHSFPPT